MEIIINNKSTKEVIAHIDVESGEGYCHNDYEVTISKESEVVECYE